MTKLPEPPKRFQEFVAEYPKLGEAWKLLGEAGQDGPLDTKTARLIKLGIAAGSMREGAVHSAVRKALAAGATTDELSQIVALSASTIGMPSAVAIYSWIQDETSKQEP